MAKPTNTPQNPVEGDPAAGPAGDPAAPISPKLARKALFGSPKQAQLEKKVAELEDRVDNHDGVLGGITKWLGELFPTSGSAKRKAPVARAPADPPKKGGFLEEVFEDLCGED